MIFDTHAHLDDAAFDDDRRELLTAMHTGSEDYPFPVSYILNCGANLATSRAGVELAEQYDFIYAAVGVHPDDAAELFVAEGPTGSGAGAADIADSAYIAADIANTAAGQTGSAGQGGTAGAADTACYRINEAKIDELRRLTNSRRVLAIGEIGLDYYWDKCPREMQKAAFLRQWELAIELGLPIEIHSREAAEDTMRLVKDMYAAEQAAGRGLRADLHCYSYSAEQAEEYLRMGFYFGVGGVLTFKNARKIREVVDMLPVERILLETDSPYLAPVPHRGGRNCSGYLNLVAQEIAQIKGLTAEEVCRITDDNARRFFGLNRGSQR